MDGIQEKLEALKGKTVMVQKDWEGHSGPIWTVVGTLHWSGDRWDVEERWNHFVRFDTVQVDRVFGTTITLPSDFDSRLRKGGDVAASARLDRR